MANNCSVVLQLFWEISLLPYVTFFVEILFDTEYFIVFSVLSQKFWDWDCE